MQKSSGTLPDEPASYRPGAVWHHQTAQDRSGGKTETSSPNGRAVVLAVAYSPDATMLASAGDDAVVRLRDLATGRVLGRLEGHGDAVSSLAFSSDGRTLATASYDRTVKLWDVATRRLKMTLAGHTNWVFSVAFATDGKSLASGGHDKTVRIWDVGDRQGNGHAGRAFGFGQGCGVRAREWRGPAGLRRRRPARAGVGPAHRTHCVRGWNGHNGTVRAVSFAPDGATLATGAEDGEVRLWDTTWGRAARPWLGIPTWLHAWRFRLAAGSLPPAASMPA